jgi:hypothetical protein
MRSWIALHVLQPLVARMDKVDAEMTTAGLGHLICESATFADGLGHSQQSGGTFIDRSFVNLNHNSV